MAIHNEPSAAEYEAILERLTNECRQLGGLLDEAKKELYLEKEFDGLTLPGGIRALKKRYYDERDKVEKLTKELNKTMQDYVRASGRK